MNSYLDYLQKHIIDYHTLCDIPGVEEQAKRVILRHYKDMYKGERFAFLTYLAEMEVYPDQKVLSTPTIEEIWRHVFGEWGSRMIAVY